MASLLFGEAIDYAKVRIYSRRYLPFGLQPRDCAMTPNGHLYFHRSRCLLDFSMGSVQAQHWFMHEMTHVWQHQLGYPVRLRGALRLGLSYHYSLSDHKTLADYNMEAQGELLADYFIFKYPHASASGCKSPEPGALARIEHVLRDFLDDPSRRQHLPKRLVK